ncbi:MAG: allantoicase, partial [Gammaproteobacteria bacterium]
MADGALNDNPFRQWIDLTQPRLGTAVVFASDEFFAARERLIDPQAPVFIADKFDDHGKWMDGWETRRRRDPGHDYCVIKLGAAGEIKGVDIDTTHFTGNFPPSASIDACAVDSEVPAASASWEEILPSVRLAGDAHHYFPIHNPRRYTHLRVNIYPDGGIARLRVFGEIRPDWGHVDPRRNIDLVALDNGGRALVCNDEHFGSMHNLNAPGRAANMGDGWETARRRQPGHDWAVLALGHAGVVKKVEIDTAHFKGNYPDQASIQAAYVKGGSVDVIATQSLYWDMLLPEVKLEMDRQHNFVDEVREIGPVTHVRLNIFPDGGVSRLRLYGHITR